MDAVLCGPLLNWENMNTKLKKKVPLTLLAVAAVAALLGTGTVQANAQPISASDASSAIVSSSAAQAAQDYWTPERMKAALPGDSLVAGKVATPITQPQAGQPATVSGREPVLKATSGPLTPIPNVGKVFFTINGSGYVCSGNSVNSTNGSTVSTAGHCINEGPGAYYKDFVFVPAYENGSAPYGKWAARTLVATSQWVNKGDINYDTGFAVVSTLNGKRLADVVGASGVAFNQARGLTYTAYGYPAGTPYDGQRLWSCAGKATNDPYNSGNTTQGIPCTMTGGSSGGPWFIGTGSKGLQNSINSYGYDGLQAMFGPYWGSAIQNTYKTAAVA